MSVSEKLPLLIVEDWGQVEYPLAFERQAQMVEERLSGKGRDTLVLTEHPPTVTLGRRGSAADLRYPEPFYQEKDVHLHRVNRGGLATAHEPGQLVVYPILLLQTRDLHLYIQRFLESVIAVLADYGLHGQLKPGSPGVWVEGRKICSFGIALKKWITSHGIAMNIINSAQTFELIVPCGQAAEQVTSLSREVQQTVSVARVKQQFVHHFCTIFGYKADYEG